MSPEGATALSPLRGSTQFSRGARSQGLAPLAMSGRPFGATPVFPIADHPIRHSIPQPPIEPLVRRLAGVVREIMPAGRVDAA
jgi:hypothetical protein